MFEWGNVTTYLDREKILKNSQYRILAGNCLRCTLYFSVGWVQSLRNFTEKKESVGTGFICNLCTIDNLLILKSKRKIAILSSNMSLLYRKKNGVKLEENKVEEAWCIEGTGSWRLQTCRFHILCIKFSRARSLWNHPVIATNGYSLKLQTFSLPFLFSRWERGGFSALRIYACGLSTQLQGG